MHNTLKMALLPKQCFNHRLNDRKKTRRTVFLRSEKVAHNSTSSKAHTTKAPLMKWLEEICMTFKKSVSSLSEPAIKY
jgi:hypothetical protein